MNILYKEYTFSFHFYVNILGEIPSSLIEYIWALWIVNATALLKVSIYD